MSIKITSTANQKLFKSNTGTIKAAVVEAVSQDVPLKGASLKGADLRGASLLGADFLGADFLGAHLQGIDAQGASFLGASLQGADLRDANLRGADFRGAFLQDADFLGADLQNAYLQGAALRGASLLDAKNAELAIAKTRILPDEGEIIGWKKAKDGRVVKLRIPADARRSHANGRKCRAERAEVLAIFDANGLSVGTAYSRRDEIFQYHIGQIAEPREPFDPDMWNECSSGIHFYITRLEAQTHV